MVEKNNQIRFLFKNVKIDSRTEGYVRKRLESLDKLLKRIDLTEVEIEMDKKGKFRVEVMVNTPRMLYRSEEISESIEGSTDIVVEELSGQIRKKKSRLETLRLRGKRSIKKNIVLDTSARFNGKE